MDPKEEKIRRFLKLFREQNLLVTPDKVGLEKALYNYQEVNIISPFYQYMSNTMKVLVSLVVVALLIGGIAYFNFAGLGGVKLGMLTDNDDTSVQEEQTFEDSVDGDINSLLASFEGENAEEINLLTSDIDDSFLAEEDLLLAEINNTYQDEL
ncbi:MAG TPA: hypothetical protein P5274_00535 [Candidatus Paceibacterota bacterium]|nr:hypothetical protein [Candidatus Paceibacterota bacterium]